jgi:ABC-type oligopeptide transport system substrate-binding subunit
MLQGARAYNQGITSDPDSVGVRALSDHTLLAKLEEPVGHFLHLLVHSAAFPLPRHALKDRSGSWDGFTNFVSNGAFVLRSWMPGEALTLARNPLHPGGSLGNLDEARVYFLDWPQALDRYGAGLLDVLDLTYLTKEERASAYRRFPDEYLTVPTQTVVLVRLITDAPPFEDALVRQALALAIDKHRLARFAIEGDPATGGVVPPGFPGYTPDIGLPFDPQRARELLAQAGYPGGRGFPPFRAYAQSNPKYAFLNDELARQWRQNLGIEPEWTWFPTEVFFNRSMLDKPDLCCFGLGAEYPDPDFFLHKGIIDHMRSEYIPGYLERLRAAERIREPQKRLTCYQALDTDLVEQAVIIPLVYMRLYMLVKPWVKGFPLVPFAEGSWKDVVIEPHD